MKVDRICKCCKRKFTARAADVRRGWGVFCSKRCKAIEQEGRTGQYAAMLEAKFEGETCYEPHIYSEDAFNE